MKIKPLIQSLIACGLLSTAFVASADITVTNRDGSKGFFSDEFIKYPIPMGDKKITSITDIDLEIVTQISHDLKQYSQTTIDEICAVAVKVHNGLNAYRQQIESQYSKEHQEIMKRLKNEEPEIITVKKGDENVSVAGYSTTQYKVYADDELIETLWLSKDKKLRKEFEKVVQLEKKMNCMLDSLSDELDYEDAAAYKSLMEKSVALKSYSDDLDEEDVQDYYADLASGDYDEDDEINISEIVKVDFGNIDTVEFAIPKNYKKVTHEEFFIALNKETIDEFNQGIDAFNENSDELIKTVEEAYAEYQATGSIEEAINKVEESTVNEATEEVEEISKKQKAMDKLKEVAEEKGGAVGKLLSNFF